MSEESPDHLVDELQRAKESLAALLEHTTDFFLVCDAKGSPVLFNEAYRRVMKAAGIEMRVGLRPHTLLPDPEEVAWWEGLHRRVLGGEAFRVEYSREFDGETHHFEFAFNPILRNGEVVGFTEISRDISERKRLELERREILEQLHQSQKMEALGNLAGGVAHDVNNVLTTIAGLASLLLESTAAGDPVRPDLVSILAACDRGHDLTRNLLGLARKDEMQTRRLSANGAVREVVELLGRTLSKGVDLRTDLRADPDEVDADPAQLNQVILNLALNASDAMRGRGALTFATASVERDGRPMLRLTVTDSGAGMDAETRARAFEPFFTTKAPGEGTGLGLSMVYGTVTSHGGHVELHSEPGRGTTVEIVLPALARSDAPADPPAARPIRHGKGNLLVVDDEPTVRLTSQRMLEKLGYSVLVADSGARALEVLRAHQGKIACVILDVMMPGMNGQETLEALRAIDPAIKVLVSSGYFREELADGLVSRGAVGFLQKPYRLTTLAEELDRALGQPPHFR